MVASVNVVEIAVWVEIALSLLINPLVGLPPLVSRGVPSLGSTARSDGAR